MGLESEVDIIEDIWCFDEWFNNVGFDRHVSAFQDVWDAKDF